MKTLGFLFLALSILLSGCTEKFGQSVDPALPKVNVINALTDKSLKCREINIEGTILIQCNSGCWFFLKDETGHILIDLAPNQFVIPFKSGKKVLVTGTVTEEKGELRIIAKGVEIS